MPNSRFSQAKSHYFRQSSRINRSSNSLPYTHIVQRWCKHVEHERILFPVGAYCLVDIELRIVSECCDVTQRDRRILVEIVDLACAKSIYCGIRVCNEREDDPIEEGRIPPKVFIPLKNQMNCLPHVWIRDTDLPPQDPAPQVSPVCLCPRTRASVRSCRIHD